MRRAVATAAASVVLLAGPVAVGGGPEVAPSPGPAGACPPGSPIWRGLPVCDEPEGPRAGFDRADYGPDSRYRALEDDVIAAFPDSMKVDGMVFTPYSCKAFPIDPVDGDAATDVDHIVALAEAHDSGIRPAARYEFGSYLPNLTIADPTINRHAKSARDAAEWRPEYHGAWYAERVIEVKRWWGLSVDPAERDALRALLAAPGAELNCVSAVPALPVPGVALLSAVLALLGFRLAGRRVRSPAGAGGSVRPRAAVLVLAVVVSLFAFPAYAQERSDFRRAAVEARDASERPSAWLRVAASAVAGVGVYLVHRGVAHYERGVVIPVDLRAGVVPAGSPSAVPVPPEIRAGFVPEGTVFRDAAGVPSAPLSCAVYDCLRRPRDGFSKGSAVLGAAAGLLTWTLTW